MNKRKRLNEYTNQELIILISKIAGNGFEMMQGSLRSLHEFPENFLNDEEYKLALADSIIRPLYDIAIDLNPDYVDIIQKYYDLRVLHKRPSYLDKLQYSMPTKDHL